MMRISWRNCDWDHDTNTITTGLYADVTDLGMYILVLGKEKTYKFEYLKTWWNMEQTRKYYLYYTYINERQVNLRVYFKDQRNV